MPSPVVGNALTASSSGPEITGPRPGTWCENCASPEPVVLPLVDSGSIQSWLNQTLT